MSSASLDAAPERPSLLDRCLDRAAGRVHMLGACGVGMAGLACLLKEGGFEVSGCDCAPGPLGTWLGDRGIPVAPGHDPDHIGPAVAWAVRSAAVPSDLPECRACASQGIPLFRRGDVLAALVSGRPSIAVGGTHGKTTTTGFIVQLLQRAGRSVAWCIGGEVDELGVAGEPPRGEGPRPLLVAEADESDGSLRQYRADIAVVTNIEFDHMEHFSGVRDFEACFREFVDQAARVVYCADDPRAAAVCGGRENAVSFGISADADVAAADIAAAGPGVEFTLCRNRCSLARVALSVPGQHNVRNALAAVAAAFEQGASVEAVRDALPSLRLPRRRLERVVDRDGVTVISDYAHHPTEIRALIDTVAAGRPDRLLAVFQPHRYTRTLALGPEFARAFDAVDGLVLTPVYAASEAPLAGGRVWDLYARFRERPDVPVVPLIAESLDQARDYFRRTLRAGDTLLVVGAGDVESIAKALDRPGSPSGPDPAAELYAVGVGSKAGLECRIAHDEPLGPKTTTGLGGRADLWLEPATVAVLAAIRHWASTRGVPFHVLGAGSNVLVSDLGVRGVAVRLRGPAFRRVREEDGCIVAGASVPLRILLDWMAERRWGGLEFLEGIPGWVGGALSMNAGAWGHSLSEQLLWVRCLNADGSECRLAPPELGMGYRRCAALRDRVAIEAGFRIVQADPSKSEAWRAELRKKRAWMAGHRSAGSVFRNPPDMSAGRLVQQAALQGLSVGGASVSRRHGNFFTAGPECTASDFRALIEIVRARVREASGVRLDTEVRFMP